MSLHSMRDSNSSKIWPLMGAVMKFLLPAQQHLGAHLLRSDPFSRWFIVITVQTPTEYLMSTSTGTGTSNVHKHLTFAPQLPPPLPSPAATTITTCPRNTRLAGPARPAHPMATHFVLCKRSLVTHRGRGFWHIWRQIRTRVALGRGALLGLWERRLIFLFVLTCLIFQDFFLLIWPYPRTLACY